MSIACVVDVEEYGEIRVGGRDGSQLVRLEIGDVEWDLSKKESQQLAKALETVANQVEDLP